MEKIVEYKIISETGTKALEDEVKKALNEGWHLLGGHQALVIDERNGKVRLLYSQAVVKYSE